MTLKENLKDFVVVVSLISCFGSGVIAPVLVASGVKNWLLFDFCVGLILIVWCFLSLAILCKYDNINVDRKVNMNERI